jgi:hypothetical protein
MPALFEHHAVHGLAYGLRAHGQRQQAEITLPTSSPGVWLCTKAIICTLNNVERTISMKLHTATTT